jgi:hypothetical protein
VSAWARARGALRAAWVQASFRNYPDWNTGRGAGAGPGPQPQQADSYPAQAKHAAQAAMDWQPTGHGGWYREPTAATAARIWRTQYQPEPGQVGRPGYDGAITHECGQGVHMDKASGQLADARGVHRCADMPGYMDAQREDAEHYARLDDVTVNHGHGPVTTAPQTGREAEMEAG